MNAQLTLDDYIKPKQKPTQKERVYEFIKSRGRVLTHELNTFGVAFGINCVGSRARELKAEGKIWHIKPSLMQAIFPHSKEEAWSVYEADRDIADYSKV